MAKQRLDKAMVERGLCQTRSQAESYISLGLVRVYSQTITKPAHMVDKAQAIKIMSDQYVSRAGLKLASVVDEFGIEFQNKIVVDVGSSTGGFTDYCLQHGAKKVIAVDVGSNQLHPKLRANERVELHEQTDIRDFVKGSTSHKVDIVVIDVSFISLQQVLPAIKKLCSSKTLIIAMCKPQFEAGEQTKNKGVIKNDQIRRAILKDFETWARKLFVVLGKADSSVAGTKGNRERFYLLKALSTM